MPPDDNKTGPLGFVGPEIRATAQQVDDAMTIVAMRQRIAELEPLASELPHVKIKLAAVLRENEVANSIIERIKAETPQPVAEDLQATRKSLATILASFKSAITDLEHYGPALAHAGPCTPESGCDGMCAEVSAFATQLASWKIQIAEAEKHLVPKTGGTDGQETRPAQGA